MSHYADRPSWQCAEDGLPWPCPDARQHLITEFAGSTTALVLYMFSRSLDAYVELVDKSPGAIWARFLGWIPTGERTP